MLSYFNSHAHVERDVWKPLSFFLTSNFNSHAHVERDASSADLATPATISTHTLTWSVTNIDFSDHFSDKFQLTRSRGAWQRYYTAISVGCNFNSHAHVERDSVKKSVFLWVKISTHTLTWSVTQTDIPEQPQNSFQLTRSRGAWPEPLK